MDIELKIDGYEVEVLDGPYQVDGAITEDCQSFIRRIITDIPKAKAFAADELLETYNENWSDDEHNETDSKGFCQKLGRPSIIIYDEIGAAVLYFPDGDMFGGHSVEVTINQGSFKYAELVG